MSDPVHDMAGPHLGTDDRTVTLVGYVTVTVPPGMEPVDVARDQFDDIYWKEE